MKKQESQNYTTLVLGLVSGCSKIEKIWGFQVWKVKTYVLDNEINKFEEHLTYSLNHVFQRNKKAKNNKKATKKNTNAIHRHNNKIYKNTNRGI